MTKSEIVEHISALLIGAITIKDTDSALKKIEHVKRLVQDLYYQIWLEHHISGRKGKSK